MTLFRQAFGAFRWSFLAESASQAFGIAVLLLLTRLLAPAEFGVVAAATIVISFTQIFVDAGLDKALIQRQQRLEESASIVFALNVVLGLLTAAVLFVAAPFIADFFHDGRVASVVRVLSLQIPIAATATVHTALLRKRLDFRSLFWIRLATTAAGAAAAVPLAILGMGYWALVGGSLAGQAAQAAALWQRSRWRPTPVFDRQLLRELTTFGGWALLSGLLGWCYTWLDAIVVGRFLGPKDLGLYRTGTAFVVTIFGLVFVPMIPVLYSSFSLSQNDRAKVVAAFQLVTRSIALLSVPLGVYLFVVSEPLSAIVFGQAWTGVALVIGLMGLKEGMAWLVGANGEVYRAIGKPHVDTWVNALMLGAYLIAYLVSIRYGLSVFLGTRLGLTLLAVAAHVLVARLVLGVPARWWLRVGSIAVPAAAGWLIVTRIPAGLSNPYAELLFRSVAFGVVVIPVVLALERSFVRELIRLLKGSKP